MTIYEKRFWAKVRKTDTCWFWTGYCDRDGYGRFRTEFGIKPAQNYAFFLKHKYYPIQFGLHTCDTPSCVNWDHVYDGSKQDNANDMVARNRIALGTKNGKAKIDETTVDLIRAMKKEDLSISAIARVLGLSRGIVTDVISGRTWSHYASMR